MNSVIDMKPAIDAFLSTHPVVQALPEHSMHIIRMCNDSGTTIAQLQKVISRDTALTSQLLKAVNSSFYALQSKILRLDRAIAFMGLRAVKEVTLSSCLASVCKPVPLGAYDARDLWYHSVGVAVMARELAVKGGKMDPEEAFLAGMLLDIGLLLFAQSEPARAGQLLTHAEKATDPFLDQESRELSFNHCELGERLALEWKFPEHLATAIRWHHQPNQAPPEQPLAQYLYVADTLTSKANIGCPIPCAGQEVSEAHLATVGVDPEAAQVLTEKLKILVRLFLN